MSSREGKLKSQVEKKIRRSGMATVAAERDLGILEGERGNEKIALF